MNKATIGQTPRHNMKNLLLLTLALMCMLGFTISSLHNDEVALYLAYARLGHGEVPGPSSMIMDSGCTRAMVSRKAMENLQVSLDGTNLSLERTTQPCTFWRGTWRSDGMY